MKTYQPIPEVMPPGRIPYPGVQIPKTVSVVASVLNHNSGTKRKMLLCKYDERNPCYKRVTDASLMGFAELGDAKERAIREYALRHGVLDAMEVVSGKWDVQLDDDGIGRTRWKVGRAPARLCDDGEPIELWRKLSGRMRAALRIAAAFKGNTALKRCLVQHGFAAQTKDELHEDWELLGWGAFPPANIATAQEMFREEVNWWLRLGGVRPQLGMPIALNDALTPWRMEMAHNGLVGGLAYRLLLMVIGEEKLYACDECGEPYIRVTRAPQPGQENFCDNCPGAAQRRALERHREKKAKA